MVASNSSNIRLRTCRIPLSRSDPSCRERRALSRTSASGDTSHLGIVFAIGSSTSPATVILKAMSAESNSPKAKSVGEYSAAIRRKSDVCNLGVCGLSSVMLSNNDRVGVGSFPTNASSSLNRGSSSESQAVFATREPHKH